MATVAVLGMGLLGAGFAENLLAKGHTVRVWNRTASRCAPLVARGAVAAETPAAAVAGAERVHLVLAEDEAVEAVVAALRPGLASGAPVIDHSTSHPARVAARFAALAEVGVRYVPAPVFMAPSNAREGTGLMLLAGPPADDLLPALAEMTGRVLHVGADPGRAAVVKLQGNASLLLLAAAMGDVLAVGAAAGLSHEESLALFETFKPTPGYLGQRVAMAGTGPASFELVMARKDVRLMIETAGGAEGLLVLPAVAAAMDAAIAAGHGAEDFAIFAHPTRRS